MLGDLDEAGQHYQASVQYLQQCPQEDAEVMLPPVGASDMAGLLMTAAAAGT